MITLIVILWLVSIFVGGAIGARKGQPVLAVVLCILFSWLGVLIVAVSQDTTRAPCPHCHEPMKRDAAICPHCRLAPKPGTDP